MKLHLPKQLFTALLAAITLATPATLTLGSTAWGVVVEDADSTAWGGSNGNSDTWYVTSDTENALESIDATTIDKTSVFIRATKDDVVRRVGTLTLKNADTLTIAGDWGSATAHFDALTIESLVIGSGEQPGSANLTVGAAQDGGTPAQAVTINSITGSVGNLNLGAASTLTLNGSVAFVAGSVLTLGNGSDLILNNAGEIVFNSHDAGVGITTTGDEGTVTIGSGTTVKLTNTGQQSQGVAAIDGIIKVLGGGKLRLEGGKSQLGHTSLENATNAVYLKGDSAGNMATMEFATDAAQHLTTNLYLQGYAQVTTAANITGHIETYDGDITATGTNNYIDAKVQVNRDITVEVTGADDTLELRGYVYGGTMTKTGAGTLTFSNAGANKNSLSNYTHNSGITELNTEFSFTGALNLQGGDLSIYGNTTISGNITQTEGTLTIQQGGNLVLNATSFAGDISLLGSGTLTLAGAYNKNADLSFTTGVTELVNFSQVGAGALNLGTVNFTGAFLMMNYEGGAIHVTSPGMVAEGMELVYGKGSQLVNLGTLNQSLTLNFFDVADQLGTGVNLGLSLGGKTLEEAKALLSVNGLQGDYTLEERGGSLYLTSTGTLTYNGWDINWGGRGHVSAPALSAEHICTNVTSNCTVVNGSYYMIDESFENGEKVVIDLQDTTNSGKSIVGGFATQTDGNAQGSVNREVWIKATAGNYAFIVGGNFANNWSSGSAADFLGDTHILVDGANVTVGSVIGANHFDSQSPTFRGNTYISVMNGTITGDIIGSGSATHNKGTNKQVGDTHVFVYNNQTHAGYVTGGGIAGGFDGESRDQRLTLEGDTHVTVDLSEQSGALTFAKNIVGAHVYKNTATPTLVHAGTTNITLIGNSDSNTRFNGLVIGGNYSAAGGTLTAGDVNMSIGASVHNIIVGGNYAGNSSTMSVGDVNMSIGSYVDNNIIGGNYTVTSNATTTAQNIAIAVSQNGHVNGNLVGGHFVNGTGTAGLSGGLGDVTITLAGGTIGDTYGGSWLKRNLATANINQGNIHINLEGGNLNGNVYAAGYQEGSSKMTTASTKVSVDSDVAIASGVTISGGYRYAENKTGSTISGSKTLVFNGESQDRSGITFDSFDTIQVTNKDTVVTLDTLSNFTALTKTGAGTLTLTNATVSNLNVAGGKLVYNSSTDTPHTISGASGSTFEKTGSGTLTANTNDYSGEILVSAGTLKNNAENQTNQKVTVATGATVDVNGKAAYYNLTLQEGATLTNSVERNSGTGTGYKQLHTITLEGDAKVTGSSELGMVGSGHATSNLHLNDHTLTKEGSNTFHLFNTTVQSQGLIQVNGGTVKADGNRSGTLNLTKASLAIDGGTFELRHCNQNIQNLTLTSGTLTIGSGLTLTTMGDTTMSGGTVSGNLCLSGTITLNGSVDMSRATLSGTSLGGFTLLASAKPANSGQQSLTYQIWSGDGSVTSSQNTISVGGVDCTMNAATGTFTTADTVYYVATGDTITVGGDSAAGGTASATSFVVDGTLSVEADTSTQSINGSAGTVNVVESTTLTLTGMGSSIGTLSATNGTVALAAGTTLTLGQTGEGAQATTSSLGTVVASSDGNTIHLNEKATLNKIIKGEGSGAITLTGSGLYELQDGAITMTSGVSLSTSWTGTVRISNVAYDGTTVNNNKMETMASTAGSGKLMLTNVNGWLGTATMSKHLILENGTGGEAALYLSNGSSENNKTKTAKFSGGISGTGDIQFNWNKSNVSNCTIAHEISGDTASWSGKFISNESGSLDVQVDFTKGGEVFSSTVDGGGVENRTDNKLLVNIGSSEYDTSFNGSIGKTSGAGAVELNVTHNNVTFNKEVNVDKLTVAQGASAQLGNTMTVGGVSFSASESATAESPAKLLANGSSALAQLAEDASFTIQDMTLTNTTITAATVDTKVNLQNVEGSTALLAKGAFTLNATPTVGLAPSGESHGTLSYSNGLAIATTDNSASLTLNLDVINAVRPDQHGTYDLSITLSGFGSDFVIEDNAILGMVKFDASSWLAQALEEQGAEWRAEITEATENTVVTQSSVPTVTYSAGTGENVGMLVITINGLNVPEPTTATLSLLALAALVARRRRK